MIIFMNTEKINGTPLSLEEIHSVLLDMMKKFAAYCDVHGLRYYLVGGTLLGAIRHHGFIPWDDDVDIGMPRPDYERFLSLVEKEPIGNNLQVLSGDRGTLSIPFAEMIDLSTSLDRDTSDYIAEKYQILHLFLDIFPQDGWPSTDAECEAVVKKGKKFLFDVQNSRAKCFHGTSLFRKIAKTPVVLFERIKGNKKIVHDFCSWAASVADYDSAKFVGSITCVTGGMGERCDGKNTRQLLKVPFEDSEFFVPGSYDEYLCGKYGTNYMELPPESKRQTHRMRVYKK